MLDRTIAPPFQVIDKVNILKASTRYLDNGLPLHIVSAGEQDLLRIELIFPAGNWYESQVGSSFFTVKMLAEGTKNRSAAEINNYIDQFGAFIDFNHSADRAGISLYTLSKYLQELLPILKELISDSVFPEKELKNLKNITLQSLKVNLEKTNYIASQKFRQLLFGELHPYGFQSNEKSIQAINREHLIQHFEERIKHKKFEIILAGKVTETAIKNIAEVLGNIEIQNSNNENKAKPTIQTLNEKKHFFQKAGSLQSSLRIGKRMFTKKHPDYFKMIITNEIFGGYFGSRLMKNIREEKGLTYGIYSNLVIFRNEGYLVIGTDVKKELTEQALCEIYKEADKMRTDLVEMNELETVRNYMLGSFAGTLNTPFDLADIFKSIYFNELDYDFYDKYLQTILEIQPEEILETSQKYLSPESMLEVVVGDK